MTVLVSFKNRRGCFVPSMHTNETHAMELTERYGSDIEVRNSQGDLLTWSPQVIRDWLGS